MVITGVYINLVLQFMFIFLGQLGSWGRGNACQIGAQYSAKQYFSRRQGSQGFKLVQELHQSMGSPGTHFSPSHQEGTQTQPS